ncbi:hypothetical protein [Streptomyces rubrogriseus]|uniref:hypothetical protein n=1 Tax=Streptomyces rubrogriseus TaxID=194673 RepID=UPI0036755CDC
METAKDARDAALTAHEVRRKEIVARRSELFLARLQQINPEIETAYFDRTDFTTRVKERGHPDKDVHRELGRRQPQSRHQCRAAAGAAVISAGSTPPSTSPL